MRLEERQSKKSQTVYRYCSVYMLIEICKYLKCVLRVRTEEHFQAQSTVRSHRYSEFPKATS